MKLRPFGKQVLYKDNACKWQHINTASTSSNSFVIGEIKKKASTERELSTPILLLHKYNELFTQYVNNVIMAFES